MNVMAPSTYGLEQERNIRGLGPNNPGSAKNNRSTAPSKIATLRGYCTCHCSQQEAG